MAISFTQGPEQIDNEQLNALQTRFNVPFPAAYREFLLQYNSAAPEPNVFQSEKLTTSVEYFFGVSTNRDHDLRTQNEVIYAGRLPARVLAIALAGGGNLICLRSSDNGIYFWDHERESAGDLPPGFSNMTRLAVSFEEFLQRLDPYRREDFLPNASRVKSVKLKPGFQEKFRKYM
jgi:hypothetical protein